MQQNSQIQARLEALGKRGDTMAILLEIVCGHEDRQQKELRELRAAIDALPEPRQADRTASAEISADMLAPSCGG